MKPIIIMALHTACRRSEIIFLKYENVDLRNKYITLTKTKSGKVRKIPISDTLLTELKVLSKNKLSEYVFTNPTTLTHYKSVNRVFPSLCKQAGITGVGMHTLRHTAGTRIVESGIDIAVCQEILGHADIKTTMRYVKPVPQRKLDAIEALDRYYKHNES